MSKFRYVIASLRLRTLPLSLGGVVLGALMAVADYRVDWKVLVLLMLTTVALQILSNLSNELGDVLLGTDTAERLGPQYGLDAGGLTIGEMKLMIALAAACAAIFGLAMTALSFGLRSPVSWGVILLGAAAIWAAMRYTLGKRPYGYRGLGDVFVFIFFGLVAVAGAYFVCCHRLPARVLLPAAAIGCFSVGVLNVNNIRDMKTDAATRVTVALKLGLSRARLYQAVMVTCGWSAMLAFTLLFCRPVLPHLLYVLTIPLFVKHLRGVLTLEGRALDPMLPLLVMSSCLFSLLAGAGFLIA